MLTDWQRIEPCGWDSHDRTYYILDDNRLYRLTDAQPVATAPKLKKNSQKAKAAARAAKRRRVSEADADTPEANDEQPSEPRDDGLGGAKWECVGANLPQINSLLQSMQKTRDENEKNLRSAIEEHLLPILNKQESSRQRKVEKREKELASLEKMAFAKRSSRLANKAEATRHEEETRQEEEQRRRQEIANRKEEQRRAKMERERDNRLLSREQRLQERQSRRSKYEGELAQLSGSNKSDARLSGRRLKAEIEKNRRALEQLDEEDDEWTFDCVCGVHGQVDDGNHSVACERCNVWQHSGCIGVSEAAAEKDDFHFVCDSCKAQLAKPTTQTSDEAEANSEMVDVEKDGPSSIKDTLVVEIPSKITTKPDLSPQAVANPSANGQGQQGQPAPQSTIPVKPAQPRAGSSSPHANGDTLNSANPFLSSHPNLSPPDQSPTKSKAYSTLVNSSPGAAIPAAEDRPSPKGAFDASGSAATSLPPHADTEVPSIPATSGSPVKQSFDSAKSPLSALSPPAVSLSSARRASHGHPQSPILSTPQLKQRNGELKSPTLPPTQNGLSPLKRSPPSRRSSSFGQSTPAASILPPVTALSPSPSQQIMTPPVKPTEPVRPASQQSSFAE